MMIWFLVFFILLKIAYVDSVFGKIRNKDIISLWIAYAFLAVYFDVIYSFFILSTTLFFLLIFISNYLPYHYIGGGDIKLIACMVSFCRWDIFYVLSIGLSIAVGYGFLTGKSRIRLGFFLAIGFILYYLKEIR